MNRFLMTILALIGFTLSVMGAASASTLVSSQRESLSDCLSAGVTALAVDDKSGDESELLSGINRLDAFSPISLEDSRDRFEDAESLPSARALAETIVSEGFVMTSPGSCLHSDCIDAELTLFSLG